MLSDPPETLHSGNDSEALCTTVHSNLRAPRRFYTTSSRLLKRCGAGWQNLRPIVKICLPLPPEKLPAPTSVVCGSPLCGAGWQGRPLGPADCQSACRVAGDTPLRGRLQPPQETFPPRTVFRSCERGVLKSLALLAILAAAASSAPNPLLPLTEPEMRSAAAIVKASGRAPDTAIFSMIALQEPPKDAVLEQTPVPRRAFAVIYDYASNRTWESVVNVDASQVDSWKEIPGAQPPITGDDSGLADRIARRDPRFARAMSERGIRDLNNVYGVSWSAGYFQLPGTEEGRVVREVFYYGGAGLNYFAHPIEGVVAHVNITDGKVLDFLDIDRNAPVSHENFDLTPGVTTPFRAAPAPLHITQPSGPGFEVKDNEVRWQKWQFRFGLQPREGLVLYTVGYEDGGRVRPILYRAALSEMVVPYGDPGGGWFFRNSFDAGELGLGVTASPQRPGIDCPENCRVFDAAIADETGNAHTVPGAISIYERDGGIAWKHDDNTRRARDLVVSFLTEAGNYEYGFDWIFHQDGTLESRVLLTGIMSAKGVADGAHDPFGHMVAKNLSAVNHQHFFTFRLDMDVDGVANSIMEMNSKPMPAGPENPRNNAFTMEETPLRTEKEARRNVNLDTSRRWIVVNPGAANAFGHPTGYALLPGENARPFAAPDSWVRKRAGFLDYHLWVTPYQASEMYAGGDYPNQSRGGDGLTKWAAANRSIDNTDLVLWYTFGVTHNPRPEDWPVMPVYEAGFKLVPWGFFARNPAMDLPPK
jgi:primary-amine oxidase